MTSLLESVQGGLLVMTQNLLPVYTNRRAKEICEQISNGKGDAGRGLPAVIIQSCQRFLREGAVNCEPLVVEYQTPQRQTIRLQIRWLDPSLESDCAHEQSRPYVLILLENCHTALEAELRLDCQKYELTDREAEIWMLLRKEYTYQEIAELLNISLNTVKTHVKNVYAKRKSSSEQGKVWYSR
ncbi:MAG: hypothetical protein HC936_05850 [Leptolyngbyaceae cyanobacterium SU_3_3]|nr:hypothetical protein [Leptolyngbyaceae cyanobacterium SU_3_3]